VIPAGSNLLVVHTGSGGASRVGLAFDRFRWPEVAGTVAGDDTVFVAVHSLKERKRVEKLLSEMLTS
jgi:transcriptional regulator of arginine metabolism